MTDDYVKRLCGLRPTGNLHIGHYFSVIEPAHQGAFVLIATYHAPRVSIDERRTIPKTLTKFKVSSSSIIFQENIFNPLLYFRLLSLTSMGELSRMTQYRGSQTKDAHLFVYPVLMAQDVAGYDEVIVGSDQTQHLNFCRTLLKRYNKKFNDNVRIPKAKLEGGKVMSLTSPTRKMSKSEPEGCLFLLDTPDVIAAKIKAAVTNDEGRKNLISLYRRLGGTETIPEMNSTLKELLTSKLIYLLETKQ